MSKGYSQELAGTAVLEPLRGGFWAYSFRAIRRFAARKPLGAFSAAIVLILVIMAIFAPWLSTFDPSEIAPDERLTGPDSENWFGTDNLGRDLYSRVIYGGRTSLVVGLGATGIAMTMALVFGVLSGYVRGSLDAALQRIVDMFMAIPSLMLLMAIFSIVRPGLLPLIVVLGVVTSFRNSRVIRSAVLAVVESQYVDAARVIGAGGLRIMALHIVPNIMAAAITVGTLAVGQFIIIEATLSFLGLGVPPPTPTWGQMLSGPARQFMIQAPWMALAPGIALTLVVWSINMLGDALRDIWDPRLRGST